MPDTKRIAELNDQFRRNPTRHGRVVMTAAVNAKGWPFIMKCMEAIKHFDAWTEDNNPYGERDFISVEVDGEKIFAKIDYYDPSMEAGSEDPADEHKTVRVLTVMFPEDY